MWTVLFSEVTPRKNSVSTILPLIVVFLSLPFFHVYALQIPNMWDINFDRSDGLQSGKSKSFPIHWNTGLDLIKTDNIIVQHYGTFS